MRLAIFSDVHGQVGRLSACLEAVARTGADELGCLGDAIDGLSPRPPELTIACVRATNDVCTVKLAGNHEAWALQDQSLPHAAPALIERWSVATAARLRASEYSAFSPANEPGSISPRSS